MSFIDDLLAIFVPHLCIGCQQEGSLLCGECRQLLPAPSDSWQTLTHLEHMQAVTEYGGLAKALLWRLKSGGAQAAARAMAECMAPLVRAVPESVIVPIPTATSHVRQRGYDQVGLLARELRRCTGVPVEAVLARSGQTHQVGSSRSQRLQQLQSVFWAKRPIAVDTRIILLDDVTTTGASLEMAAQVLRNAGACHVEGLVFACTPHKNKPKAVP